MIASLTTFTTLGTVIYLIVCFDGGGVLLNVLTTDIPTSVSVTTTFACLIIVFSFGRLLSTFDDFFLINGHDRSRSRYSLDLYISLFSVIT